MKKISNTKLYILSGAVLFCIIAAILIRYLFFQREINAFVSSYEIFKNEALAYSDSTFNAKEWLWEFGNGEISTQKSGEYIYGEPGRYQLRLTVDQSLTKEMVIHVKPPVRLERDSLIRIEAPSSAMQDEYIIFRGIGPSKEWRWSFGETGIIDSRDQAAIYSYAEPGIYEVELMTEETRYPVRHLIEILPMYAEEDTTDVLSLIGNDIRERLQAIVDGKPFNTNYNHVMTKYLCDDPNTSVTINNEKKNDFYSYCQGLKIIGRKNTTIVEVIVVPDDQTQCINRLYITQFSHDDELQ